MCRGFRRRSFGRSRDEDLGEEDDNGDDTRFVLLVILIPGAGHSALDDLPWKADDRLEK